MSTLIKWVIGAVIGVVVVVMTFIQVDPKLKSSSEEVSLATSQVMGMIEVRIEGQVNHPGTYSLSEDATLQDLIELAGGLLSTADPDSIDPSLALNGVPFAYIPILSGYSQSCVVDPNAKKVNVNSATAEELDEVDGLSLTLAERIVAYRNEHGSFHSIEELMNVVGLGTKTYEKIRDKISLR